MVLRARHARSVTLLWLCGLSLALAVNLVYDEVLWTKKIWPSAKVSNPLLYTNPSEQEPRLLDVYPGIRGSMANSLDGPNERRDGSNRPADPDGDGFHGFPVSGMQSVSETGDVKPASVAAQCSVCHVVMVQVWQNLTERVVDNLVLGPRSARAQLMGTETVKKQLVEACRKEAAESLLSKQTILRLTDPSGQVAFFVLRERRKGGNTATTAEHKAVRLACKRLVREDADDLTKSVIEMLTLFAGKLEAVLSEHDLLGEDIDIPAIVNSDGRATANDPSGAPWPPAFTRALQAASLVKGVLRRVWPEAGGTLAPTSSPPAPANDNDDDDDDYEDEDDDALDPDCMDLHPMCLSWADKGECEANPNYMVGSPVHKGHCKKSCGVCIPRRKGERSTAGLIDSTELKRMHPELPSKVERIAAPLQIALGNSACGASRACLTGVSGTSAGGGFIQGAVGQVQQGNGWQLEKPHFGRAMIETLSKKDLKLLEAARAGHAPVEPGSVAAEVDEVLGEEFKGKVISVNGDFFTYEYVYKNHTRHYHVTDDGLLTEDYLLGSFKRESVNMQSALTGTVSVLDEKDLLPDIRQVLMKKEWPYVKQVYAGGDTCVLNGGRRVDRKAEVRIACSPDNWTYMLVREPDFCQYVFVLYTPSLCKVERFKPQAKPQPKEPPRKPGDDDLDLDDDEDDEDEYL